MATKKEKKFARIMAAFASQKGVSADGCEFVEFPRGRETPAMGIRVKATGQEFVIHELAEDRFEFRPEAVETDAF